jgi:integrase/recombinase XerD
MNEKIIKICEQKFIYLNYSERTRENYIPHIRSFLKYLGDKQVAHCNSKDFQNYLDNYKFSSVSQQNQVINAIRFLYKYGLDRKYDKVSFQRPRSEKKLPLSIKKEYLLEKINGIQNSKHKAIIALAYSTGMRVSEVVNLKIEDFDLESNLIFIRNGKGRKDRVVPLSGTVRGLLRLYWDEYKPICYVFNGSKGGRYSARSCNEIVKKYLGEKFHFHTLRHSALTNLAENQVNLSVIQKIAGHSSPKTSSLYIHLSNNSLNNLPLAI